MKFEFERFHGHNWYDTGAKLVSQYHVRLNGKYLGDVGKAVWPSGTKEWIIRDRLLVVDSRPFKTRKAAAEALEKWQRVPIELVEKQAEANLRNAVIAELERAEEVCVWTYTLDDRIHYVTESKNGVVDPNSKIDPGFPVLVPKYVGGEIVLTRFVAYYKTTPEHRKAAFYAFGIAVDAGNLYPLDPDREVLNDDKVTGTPKAPVDPICVWVQVARACAGYSQAKLGELTGIAQSAIARTERGQVPSVATLRKLCKVLGPYTIGE